MCQTRVLTWDRGGSYRSNCSLCTTSGKSAAWKQITSLVIRGGSGLLENKHNDMNITVNTTHWLLLTLYDFRRRRGVSVSLVIKKVLSVFIPLSKQHLLQYVLTANKLLYTNSLYRNHKTCGVCQSCYKMWEVLHTVLSKPAIIPEAHSHPSPQRTAFRTPTAAVVCRSKPWPMWSAWARVRSSNNISRGSLVRGRYWRFLISFVDLWKE